MRNTLWVNEKLSRKWSKQYTKQFSRRVIYLANYFEYFREELSRIFAKLARAP
jgi:hypothetical protein